MNTILALVLVIASLFEFTDGDSLIDRQDPPKCGDWTPFKDEKCFKILERAGFQTQKDAEVLCNSFSEELQRESSPRLITIKSKEEQEFLQHYLFVQNNIVDNVWLSLKASDTNQEFKWNDGTTVEYSNWANQNMSDDQHKCVQLASGEGSNESGSWVKVNCQKRLIVVCERNQTWTLETLQDIFLNYRKEVAKRFRYLEQNPVPPGFIYMQLPGQQPPHLVWPQVSWKDISSQYEGLFFRVVGGKAAPFNELQTAFAPVVNNVQFSKAGGTENSPVSIPTNGDWSSNVVSGGYDGAYCSLSFRMTVGEVRPINKAVIVWQRSD